MDNENIVREHNGVLFRCEKKEKQLDEARKKYINLGNSDPERQTQRVINLSYVQYCVIILETQRRHETRKRSQKDVLRAWGDE